jgi:hypothetical protein
MGQEVPLTDRCCGDSGSFAYSRPDIATQVKFRKQQDIEETADKLRADGFTGDVKILTSCPACLQGLSRYDDDADTKADYIVVELAKHLLGDNWMVDYVFGNMTPHLHWHVIPRWQDDRHFPEPIWGAVHNAFPARRSDVSDEDLIEAFRINLPSGNSQG